MYCIIREFVLSEFGGLTTSIPPPPSTTRGKIGYCHRLIVARMGIITMIERSIEFRMYRLSLRDVCICVCVIYVCVGGGVYVYRMLIERS